MIPRTTILSKAPWRFTPYIPNSIGAGTPEGHDDTEDKDEQHVPVALTQPQFFPVLRGGRNHVAHK